jgi:hypothetical protein
MEESEVDLYEVCSFCGMRKHARLSRRDLAWGEEHEEIYTAEGLRVFCFLKGDTAETFWSYLGNALVDLGDLGAKSCTYTAIAQRRSPDWIRQCALEEMNKERITNRRERYERIANFCQRRAYELAPELELAISYR